MPDWLYRVVGLWVRREACRLAAQALRATDIEEGYMPLMWSMTVFFEDYLLMGASGTREAFGPKDPTELRDSSAAA